MKSKFGMILAVAGALALAATAAVFSGTPSIRSTPIVNGAGAWTNHEQGATFAIQAIKMQFNAALPTTGTATVWALYTPSNDTNTFSNTVASVSLTGQTSVNFNDTNTDFISYLDELHYSGFGTATGTAVQITLKLP